MKRTLLQLISLITLAASPAQAHENAELGPNGGRILEFSRDESLHGEVVAKDGKFHITLLDKEMKPVAIDKHALTATGGDRNNPEKLPVEKEGDRFTVPMLKGDDFWVIFQLRRNPEEKPVTARLHYQTKVCSKCEKPEWLCECGEQPGKKAQ